MVSPALVSFEDIRMADILRQLYLLLGMLHNIVLRKNNHFLYTCSQQNLI